MAFYQALKPLKHFRAISKHVPLNSVPLLHPVLR
jgi:hypothetical protein